MNDPYYRNRLLHSKALRRSQRAVRPLSEEIRCASRLLIVTITGLLLATTVGFLYVSSLQSAKGYQLKELQEGYENLLIENRELQQKLNEAQAITRLRENEKIEGMRDPNTPEQALGEDNGMALR